MDEPALSNIPAAASSAGATHLLLALLGIGLAGGALLLAFSFVLHFYDVMVRGARTPAPFRDYLTTYAVEAWFTLAYAISFLPGYLPSWRWAEHRADGNPPILLVHGFFLNRACMFAIYWRLRRAGFHQVYTVNLKPLFGPIESAAAHLAPRIRDIVAHHSNAQIHVVAHSMGGLVMRRALHVDPQLPVASVVTLGTPHQGSMMASFGISTAARQMRIGSGFLAGLPAEPAVPFISISSEMDNLVLPNEHAAFGCRSIQLDRIGHLSLLYSQRVFEAVVDELRRQMRDPHPA
jgi:triacylglycerol lipase